MKIEQCTEMFGHKREIMRINYHQRKSELQNGKKKGNKIWDIKIWSHNKKT